MFADEDIDDDSFFLLTYESLIPKKGHIMKILNEIKLQNLPRSSSSASTIALDNESEDCDSPHSSKKIKLEYDPLINLKQFLESSRIGRSILLSYDLKKDLNQAERSRLVHLVVDGIIEIHEKIKNEDFETISGEIMNIFPTCLLYTSPSPRDKRQSRMPSSA